MPLTPSILSASSVVSTGCTLNTGQAGVDNEPVETWLFQGQTLTGGNLMDVFGDPLGTATICAGTPVSSANGAESVPVTGFTPGSTWYFQGFQEDHAANTGRTNVITVTFSAATVVAMGDSGMAELQLVAGTTSKTVKLGPLLNSSTGAPLTGLAYGTSGLTAYYIIEGQSGTHAISLVTATLGTWTSGGFIVVDGTNMPGMYELGIPNAALTGGKSVIIYVQGAANLQPYKYSIELTAVNNQSATAFEQSIASVGGVTDNIGGNLNGVQQSYPQQNGPVPNYMFMLFNTNGTPYTGSSSAISGVVSLAGATAVPLTNTASIAAVSGINGAFQLSLASADTNALTCLYVFSAPGCITTYQREMWQGTI